MKLLPILVCSLATLLFAGCSTTPTRVDKGPIKANSFSFVNPGGAPPDYADQRAEVHKLIQDAITTDLARLGVTRVASGGDVTVAYLVIVGNNASTTAINDYFGYGRDGAELGELAHEKYIQSKNPNYFEAGTIIIDVIDAHTNRLLRRHYATRPVLANPSNEVRAARIQQAVDEALQGLRIVH